MQGSPASMFFNSEYIVVEYIDLIKSPYLSLLSVIRQNTRLHEIIDVEPIKLLELDSLQEWYVNRKHQNFFLDLSIRPEITKEVWDQIIEDQLKISPRFFQAAKLLPLGGSLKVMKVEKLVKDILIYYPHHDEYAKSDLERILKEEFHFYDNFDEVMDIAGNNSTYFLSNVDLIDKMRDKGILKMSSVTVPIEYRYNKKDMTHFKFDFKKLFEEQPFKLSYIQACSSRVSTD